MSNTSEDICLAKLAYRTVTEARRAAVHQSSVFGIPFEVYNCPECRDFHLTSKSPRLRAALEQAIETGQAVHIQKQPHGVSVYLARAEGVVYQVLYGPDKTLFAPASPAEEELFTLFPLLLRDGKPI
jgi:hypothetical protein